MLRRRILVGQTASAQVLADYTPPRPAVTKALLEAFARQRTALVQYEDRHGAVTEREIELQFLYYNLPGWYAMAWDLLRDDIRSFRIDRIRHVRVLPTTFRLRPPDPFRAAGLRRPREPWERRPHGRAAGSKKGESPAWSRPLA